MSYINLDIVRLLDLLLEVIALSTELNGMLQFYCI
jgi:hypothetical protein